MKFSDIVGQSVLVNSLRRAVEEDKVANGYIFCGPKGCGKKLTAFIFAAALNCKGEDKPCEHCASCIKFSSGNHPNIEVVSPTGATIKIKQIREVISEVSKTSFESGCKVIIIDSAEKMTHEAQDAFLKTLEEPPGNTVFLLLVENHYSLLPTIVSRCQVYAIKRVSNNDVEDYLRGVCKTDEAKIKLATAHSSGIIGRAVQIIKDESYFELRNKYVRTIMQFFDGTYVQLSASLGELVSTREEANAYLDFLFAWFRDVLLLKELQEEGQEMIINIDRLEELRICSDTLTSHRLNDILDIIKDTVKQVKHNVNVKNSIDVMVLNIMEVSNG